METIFISIACFMDSDIINTIENCISQAKNPESLYFGICFQDEMNNTILLEIRIVFNFIVGKVVIENEDSIDNFLPSSGINRDIYRKFLIEKEYVELYCYLKEYFGKKLDIIAKVKNFDITGQEIIEHIILDDDPFKWYNNVKHFF